MITKTQAGGGAAAVVAVGTGTGVGLVVKGKLDEDDESQFSSMPQFTILSLETNFSTIYPRSSDGSPAKVGRLYRGYLTGTYGVGDSSKDDFNDNSAWWDWSYKRWERDVDRKVSLSSEFSKEKIVSPFSSESSTDVDKALNKVCETLYKKEQKIVALIVSLNDQEKKLGNEILRYCSPLGKKPKTIQETKEKTYSGDSNSLGFRDKAYLVSVKDASNDLFWELRNDDFFSNSDSHWKGPDSESGTSSKFRDLYSQGKSGSKTVKKVCEETYSLSSSNEHVQDVLKYCSWNYGIIG